MQNDGSYSKVSGIIGKGTVFKGDISFIDSFRIDGVFKGKILSGNHLIIGENGDIEADIEVNSLSINGKIKGSLTAKDRVEIFSKGKVTGKIICPKLKIDEGAFFQGTCQMELKSLENKNPEIINKSL